MIRHKVLSQLLVILLIALGLFVGFYLFMLRSYERLEQQDIELNRRRVLNTLDLEIERLDEVTRGWARSGMIHFLLAVPGMDLYRNLTLNAISGSFDISEVAIIDSNHQLFSAREGDTEDESLDTPLDEHSPFITAVLQSSLPVHEEVQSARRGLAFIEGSIHLVSSHPNLDFEKKLGGTSLTAAVHYNDAAIARLERIVEQGISIMPLQEFESDAGNRPILDMIRNSSESVGFVPVSRSLVHSYTLLNDYTGVPAFIVRVGTSRNFFEQDSGTLLIAGLGGGLMFLVLIAWFLVFPDKSVLRRLERLSGAVAGLSDSRLQERLPVKGRDEITAFMSIAVGTRG